MQPYMITKTAFDASRPWLVFATFRNFNRGMGRYATAEQAMRRARSLNAKSEIKVTA